MDHSGRRWTITPLGKHWGGSQSMAALLGLLQAFEDLVFNVQISIDSLKIMKAHLFTNPNLRVIFSCYYLIIFS